MKKKILMFCFISIGVIMSSCSNDEMYSCDPEANEWAKQNKSKIAEMNRSEWKQMTLKGEYRMAAFRAFSPEQQQSFWINKLEEVLNMNWSEKEKNHIQLLLNFCKETDVFSKGVSDEFEIFAYKWLDYGRETLKWNSSTMYGICATGYKMLDKEGNLEIQKTISSHLLRNGNESGQGDCGCSQKSDWCDLFNEIPGSVIGCNPDSCVITEDGCGLLWQFACDGICKSPIA